MDNAGEKNYFKIVAVVVVALVILAAGWHWAGPAYRQHKEKRNVAEAQAFLARGDYRNAWLCASVAHMLNSNSVPAARVLATVAEAARSPVALDLRQQIADREPTADNQLALALAGLRFQNPPFALTQQILEQLPDTATNLTAFQSVAAELALRLNRPAEAATHLEAALRLEPTNSSFQLNLAVLRVNSTNAAVAGAARDTLKGFRTDTNLGPTALRALVTERLVHDDAAAARDYATQLLASAQSNLGDRLQYLSILKRLQSPDLAAQLNAVQRDVATNALLTAQTAAWMQGNGFMADSVNWLTNLPAGVQTQPPVQLALVDYYSGTTNWAGLSQLTAKGDWGEMNFLRLAFLSHAWSELGEPGVANANWNSAVNQSGDQLGALNTLLELAVRWQMKDAVEELLGRIVRKYPGANWAQQNLERLYVAAGETRKLYQLYAAWLPHVPQNAAVKNNLAATALLLKTNLTQAGQWAEEVYAQAPNSPEAVSTYAYALHVQGRDSEALAALQKLTPAQLKQSSVALYYGVLLAATGDPAKAAPYLAIAEKDNQLLPEEKQLLATAEHVETLKR